ncbi:MAG: alanine--tRNA ligase [Proteobacteria bacterium]|nr:MAG: alanine--tRNA ligase [Pseudomonadota bacterium]
MKVAEIRSRFLKFFENHGHSVQDSSSLVPSNDPTLLFVNAGMVQFKDVFLGKDRRAYTRAATSQKCVRAGGKHNDLENVGYTARHHTFFEMLGNFSFGDYFKQDAIRYAWDFITKELKLPVDKLYVTVYKDDDEAALIWEKEIGVDPKRIYRFGEKDNFWSMGDTGPCGPCTELFVDRGAKYGCGKSTCEVGCDCDRYMEFWNLVFMQFNRDAEGVLHPLPKPSVDTGMGLERIASILQETETNYEIDSFIGILENIAKLAGHKYDPKGTSNFPYRVIADHSRAMTFLIGDGVMPSNEGRGYVLRRIIRRAVRYGKKIGLERTFLAETCGYVIDQMKDAYTDLEGKRSFILRVVQAEEEQFLKTLERGLNLLDEEVAKLGESKMLSGEVAFRLYDTFGFPIDLTRVICEEQGLTVDEPGFEQAMLRQKTQSRQHWKGGAAGDNTLDDLFKEIANEVREKNLSLGFVGYDANETEEGRLIALIQEKDGKVVRCDFAGSDASDYLYAIFDITPFYGEGGGQVGDKGSIKGHGFEGEVFDAKKPADGLTVVHVKPIKGTMKVGESYLQATDLGLRSLTARNHTATHMLHWALRHVLGDHVKQAGSLVNPEMFRFDFSHFQAVTEEELQKIEDLINERIFTDLPVSKKEMKKEEAVAAGAIAMFGEKYGDRVRVVRVGGFSTELCGGTHVSSTAEINLFKIGSESSVAAGVRRIVGYTSKYAFDYLKGREQEAKLVRAKLKAVSFEDVEAKIDRLVQSERDLKKQIDKFKSGQLAGQIDSIIEKAEVVKGTKIVSFLCPEDESGVKTLRDLSEQILAKAPESVAILGMQQSALGKAFLLISKGKKAPAAVNAQTVVNSVAPLFNGKGGGKAEMAQAGGDKLEGLKEALAKAPGLIKESLA